MRGWFRTEGSTVFLKFCPKGMYVEKYSGYLYFFKICYVSQIIKDYKRTLTSLKVLVHKSKKEEQPSCKKADEKVMSAINLLVLENRARTEILPLFC